MQAQAVEQRSPEWFEARKGIPTASSYKKIFTSEGKNSKTADAYMNELIAGYFNVDVEPFENKWTKRGSGLEEDAFNLYQFETGKKYEQVGFITALDGNTGCSPDLLVDDDGGAEIKCTKATTHISYLRKGTCPTDYYPQIQGCMYVTGRKTWDFVSYHPELPLLVVPVPRDEVWIKGFDVAIKKFIEKMLEERKRIEEMYHG